MLMFVAVEVTVRCMAINPRFFFLIGSAGCSPAHHRGLQFSTKDRDNDRSKNNCASSMKGGWWYNSCQHSHLNGNALESHSESVERSEMKVRPKDS